MANILYAAISQDGFIAGPHDETPWSDAEWQAFQEFLKKCDVALMGRRTYEIMQRNGEFVPGPEYMIATRDNGLDTDTWRKITIDSPLDMPEGECVGIIGGGELNGRLAELGVIDEVILDIEPIILKTGIKLFGAYSPHLKLKLIDSHTIGDNTVQRHYKVIR